LKANYRKESAVLNFFAKRLRELHEVERDERGFTLIELLVVCIIVGILAAIAIPTFLAQRDRANEAALASDLRNLAAAATSCSADQGGSYAGPCDTVTPAAGPNNDLRDYGFNPTQGVNITDAMITGTATDFTVAGATHVNLPGVTGSFTTTGVNAGRVIIT
jgi:type IV pilus assembly protein PilA